jgi:SAM-dependent methyltransferase
MAQPSKTSQNAPERVQKHFQEQASSFDELYGADTNEEAPLQRTLRPGLFRRRELAVSVVRSYDRPRILDVGCGSGRIGEFLLEAGASEYVGNDFSRPMLDLAEARLAKYGDRVRFVEGDFLDVDLGRPYDVVVGLGLFDYLPDPERFARRMYELTADRGTVVGSFPKWSWVKGPIRKIRYELINNCPIFNYTERELRLMFGACGFREVDVQKPGHSGFLLRAVR